MGVAFAIPWTGIDDLAAFLQGQLGALPPTLVADAEWVMDELWETQIKAWLVQIGVNVKDIPGVAETLFGIPLVVRPDGGWPHLRSRRAHGRGQTPT
jgi:hypothetical protein